MRKLQLHPQGRYLQWDDGRPFFYLADTAWELFHRLKREEIDRYMAVRARQGFTALQAVALAEFEGLTVPNAYGRLPLTQVNGAYDPTQPDEGGAYDYWRHVDYAMQAAERAGLVVALLPTWGDKFNLCWGKGPVVFTPENAKAYGLWLGRRYARQWNLIWMLGGDRPLEPAHRQVIDAMAQGLREGDGGAHLITFHPPGGKASTDFVGDADYISFHTAQTGHDTGKCYESYREMARMANHCQKPYLDSEPRYEDHPACFKAQYGFFWGADDVRQNAYWDVLAGACGHTYGNHCIWSMNQEKTDYFPYLWSEALEHPGAEQMRHVRTLRESRDYFSYRPDENFVQQNAALMGHLSAGQGEGYAYVYSPLGLPFVARLALMPAKVVKASWFDPRTGQARPFAILPGGRDAQFVPPTSGKGNDWVLILDRLD